MHTVFLRLNIVPMYSAHIYFTHVFMQTMPWGPLSVVKMESPLESNDGPILWIRPGEQLVPTADMPAKSPFKRKRTGINELRNLQYLPRLSEAREYMFEDRTKAHADHVGHGLDRMTTAAVGKLSSKATCLDNIPYSILLSHSVILVPYD